MVTEACNQPVVEQWECSLERADCRPGCGCVDVTRKVPGKLKAAAVGPEGLEGCLGQKPNVT